MRYVPPVCSAGVLRQPLVLESRMQTPLASDPSGFLIVPTTVTIIAVPVGAGVGVAVRTVGVGVRTGVGEGVATRLEARGLCLARVEEREQVFVPCLGVAA